jgi:hypothetical protein
VSFGNEIAEELVIAFATALIAGAILSCVVDTREDFAGILMHGRLDQIVELDAVVRKDDIKQV